MQKSMSLLGCWPFLKAIWSNSHLCCPDARDLLRLTLAGWWGVRPHSWIPLVCPGKTLARPPQVASLLVLSGPVRGLSAPTWWGRSRWTEPATGSRWSPGCCTWWAAGLRVQFLRGDTGLEMSWNYWPVFLSPSGNWAQSSLRWLESPLCYSGRTILKEQIQLQDMVQKKACLAFSEEV